jgi:2-oxoglutarate ferredoxin oxidoreductase subunit gamma
MTQKERGEVIFTGIGGGGVLLAGECVVQAARKAYEHLVWFPNYSAAVRGGPCECTVVFSDQAISSPVLSRVQTVVVLDPAQLAASEKRVRPGGTLIVESTGLTENAERRDITVIKVPALQQAREAGNVRGTNFIILGWYVGTTGLIDPALVEEYLATKFGGSAAALTSNLEAFRLGLAACAAAN